MPLAAGTKLDGYEVLGLLGAGGMGEVYRARDPPSSAKWRSRSCRPLFRKILTGCAVLSRRRRPPPH